MLHSITGGLVLNNFNNVVSSNNVDQTYQNLLSHRFHLNLNLHGRKAIRNRVNMDKACGYCFELELVSEN